jgi:hypothetical protein
MADAIETVEPGFSVLGSPPIAFADAGRQLRAIRAADTLESSVHWGDHVDQEGEGIASKLRDLAVRIGKEALQRKLGLHHVSNVAKVLGHLSKHHSGVAAEDAAHATAAADVYLAPDKRRAEGYDAQLSTPEVAVYRRPAGRGGNLVAFRGSANYEDAKTDGHLALGRLRKTDRWKRTAAHARQLKEVLGEYSVTGHSLGGTLAQHVHDDVFDASQRKRGRLVAFNPGATLLGPIPGRDGRVYSTSGDVVSALSHTTHKDVRVLTPREGSDLLSAHGASNFTEP